MKIMFTTAVAALFANAVSVHGACSWPPDGAGASVGGVVLKEDADGVVRIPDDWTEIPSVAFLGCQGMKRIEIPASITSIGAMAFASYDPMEIVFDANSQLEIIASSAFKTAKMTTLVIPKSVTEIEDAAFSQCSILEEVIVEAGSRLKKIGIAAFDESHKLTTMNIPKCVNVGPIAFEDTGCNAHGNVFKGGNTVVNCVVTASLPCETATVEVDHRGNIIH